MATPIPRNKFTAAYGTDFENDTSSDDSDVIFIDKKVVGSNNQRVADRDPNIQAGYPAPLRRKRIDNAVGNSSSTGQASISHRLVEGKSGPTVSSVTEKGRVDYTGRALEHFEEIENTVAEFQTIHPLTSPLREHFRVLAKDLKTLGDSLVIKKNGELALEEPKERGKTAYTTEGDKDRDGSEHDPGDVREAVGRSVHDRPCEHCKKLVED